ncbi:MAG: hypothetical protein RLZZ70_44 [Candidatus Parcubacteria bacterium]
MSRFLAFLTIVFLSTAPLMVSAADFVICGKEGQPPCQTCHAVQVVNNVIEWLILILGTIAAIIIVYAGFQLVTSGGNTSAKEKAKDLITNMFIGYAIVLAGWLLIDTGMKMLLTDGSSRLGVWNQVQCTAQPQALDKADFAIGDFTPYVDPIMVIPGAGGSSGGGGSIGGGAHPPNMSAAGACAVGSISPFFGSQTGNAQCVIEAESSCGAVSLSRTDVMKIDGRPFSFGPMQINLTVHTLNDCNGTGSVLRCLDAFSGRNYDARVVNEALYQQCARAAQNVSCNIRNGARIYKEAGNSWRPWSTARGCGLI